MNFKENMENTGNGKHYFKQSSLTSSSIYDYIAVYDIRYTVRVIFLLYLFEGSSYGRKMFKKFLRPLNRF